MAIRPAPYWVLPLAALLTTGCTPVRLALGQRTRLEGLPIQRVSLDLAPGSGLGPGDSAALVATASAADGQAWVTEGAGHGRVLWDSYELEAVGATVSPKGIVRLDEDPRGLATRPPRVRATTRTTPPVTSELLLPVRYDRAFRVDFAGAAGASGFPGLDGVAGGVGSMGSLDPEHPSAGGDGGPGGDGGDGGSGWDGGPGSDLRVQVALQPGPRPLLQVKVASASRVRYVLVDPDGGSLHVSAEGGPGGAGGRMGRGGSGGIGGAGTPPGNPGSRGLDGRDGSDGHGGPGGRIRVEVDPSARPWLKALTFSNQGGRPGGRGGPPVEIVEATVPPLW